VVATRERFHDHSFGVPAGLTGVHAVWLIMLRVCVQELPSGTSSLGRSLQKEMLNSNGSFTSRLSLIRYGLLSLKVWSEYDTLSAVKPLGVKEQACGGQEAWEEILVEHAPPAIGLQGTGDPSATSTSLSVEAAA